MDDVAEQLDRAIALVDQGDLAAADSLCEEICSAEPEQPGAYYLRGLIAYQSGGIDAAVDLLKKAEELGAEESGLKRALAAILLASKEYDAAAARYRDLLSAGALNEGDASSLAELGEGYRQSGLLGSAVEWFSRSRALNPNANPAVAGLFLCGQLACDWRERTELEAGVEALTKAALDAHQVPVEDPFVHITRSMESVANHAVARAWCRPLLVDTVAYADREPGKELIRLGYLSSDFHEHATAYLMHRLFALHDRDQFEVYAYSCEPGDGSEIRKRLETECDSFVDVAGWPAERAASSIADDKIDILIDLKGHTRKNRLDIAARRPAPLQITYLGFPGTSGADFFDYVVADSIVLPENDWQHYSETPLLMPHCYQINSHTRLGDPMSRGEVGLPESGTVFCSFTNTYKIEPIMFASWMKILESVSDSVLWLCVNNALAEENLKREAEAHGVDAERLIFAPFVDQETHLRRLSLADLALDTRIYNGHTTTSDALWAGVPVLTVRGRHFASRVSESILAAIGLEELVSEDLDAFERRAVDIASDDAQSPALKAKIAAARAAAPLFDTPRFVANFERGLAEIWRKYAAREDPAPIILTDT